MTRFVIASDIRVKATCEYAFRLSELSCLSYSDPVLSFGLSNHAAVSVHGSRHGYDKRRLRNVRVYWTVAIQRDALERDESNRTGPELSHPGLLRCQAGLHAITLLVTLVFNAKE